MNFNSTIVRLILVLFFFLMKGTRRFQFYYSAINTKKMIIKLIITKEFQFYYSAINLVVKQIALIERLHFNSTIVRLIRGEFMKTLRFLHIFQFYYSAINTPQKSAFLD